MKHFQSRKFGTVLGIFLGLSFFVIPLFAVAQLGSSPPTGTIGSSPPSSSGQGFSVVNPLKVDSFAGLVQALLQAAIIIGIPIAVLFIVFAGLKFVLALGSPDKLTTAKRNFFYTVIGVGIFLAASLIAQVIFSTVKSLGSGV